MCECEFVGGGKRRMFDPVATVEQWMCREDEDEKKLKKEDQESSRHNHIVTPRMRLSGSQKWCVATQKTLIAASRHTHMHIYANE